MNEDFALAIGFVAYDLGQRPSDLVGWTGEEDFVERLLFDAQCMGLFHGKEATELKRVESKRWLKK